MKNITITVGICNECPYRHKCSEMPGTYCSHEDVKSRFNDLSYSIDNNRTVKIPDWCPLEDA